MRDFLLELGFEELPARFVDGALQQLKTTLEQNLKEERLKHGEISVYSTPRRLALIIQDLKVRQTDLKEEVKGPPKNIAYDESGALTKAGQGFLRSQGITEDAIVIKQFQGADYLFATKEVAGKDTAVVLESVLAKTIKNLNFPKNMRWDASDLRFARPLRWLIALFGNEVIPVEIGNLVADRITYGHRQLSSGPLVIGHPAQYVDILRDNYVLVDQTERAGLVRQQVKELAQSHSGQADDDDVLFKEVVNLVEYPTAFCGEFSPEYLEIPAEVLITSMKEHQRYFPLFDKNGQLLPKFISVRNGADNHLANVILGNERVLEARLADAKFFFAEDSKINLEENLAKLNQVVFQAGLGSMGDKVSRIERLSRKLAEKLAYHGQLEVILRTAKLAKADLVSQMVYEFPELQGVMGEKYALLQGESKEVAAGIREHYLPRFAGDALPLSTAGKIVSLADKLDTLVGYFALGKIPTGSQDPFALRRQAQGVVQILLHSGFELSLRESIQLAAEGYKEVELTSEHAAALLDFFLARLRVLLLDKGYSYDVVDAVMASSADQVELLVAKVQALADFRAKENYIDLSTGFERVANLAQRAETDQLNKAHYEEADQSFATAVEQVEQKCKEQLEQKNYAGVLITLAEFRRAIDEYFDAVMIMAQDLEVRANRLALLYRAYQVYILYGDFGQIVVN